MNFVQAMEQMLQGCYVRRKGWLYPHTLSKNTKDEWVILYTNGANTHDYLLDAGDIKDEKINILADVFWLSYLF